MKCIVLSGKGGGNRFSAPSTTLLLTALSTSPSIEILEGVSFEKSANLEEEDACIALTDFLAAATEMEMFHIHAHEGRFVTIEVNVASEDGKPGEVIVTDNMTN